MQRAIVDQRMRVDADPDPGATIGWIRHTSIMAGRM
jgi:hypothetical protein